MRVGIVLNGALSELSHLDACQWVVAADGAADRLIAAGRTPDLIVGDLDSIDPTSLQAQSNVAVEAHPRHKDETDGELAFQAALAKQPEEIYFFGVQGGRTAMILANLKLLRQAREAGTTATAISERERIRFLLQGDAWAVGAFRGGTLNVLAVGGPATVQCPGTGWPEETTLDADSVRGVSNPIRSVDATLHVRSGAVLAVAEFA